MEKGSQLKALLNSAGKSSAEMTHNLSEYGDGKMADGIFKLWKSGQYNGMVKGAAIASLAFGTFALIANALEERNFKAALSKIDLPYSPPTCTEIAECEDEKNETVVANPINNEEDEQK